MALKLGFVLPVVVLSLACGWEALPQAVNWEPSRITMSPTTDLVTRIQSGQARAAMGKYPARFYQKLRARPAVAALAEVDIWQLRDHPRQYDIITIGPVSLRQYSGRHELLDQLAVTHRLSKEKAEILANWIKAGGILWSEFGVFVQGHEWIREGDARQTPSLPDLKDFTILGLPTRSVGFEADRRGSFSIERKVYTVHNEARHTITSDIRVLKLIQSDLRAVYPIISPERGAGIIQEGEKNYATVVSLGEGKIISTVPFDVWDVESDGEKFRINLAEWLAGYPIPTFDPDVRVETKKD